LKTSNIFQYFEELEKENKIPDVTELEALAFKLYQNYSTTRAIYRALNTTAGQMNEWSMFIPRGSPWNPPPIDKTSAGNTGSTKFTRKQSAQSKRVNNNPSTNTASLFKGDRTLAKSITVMRDFIWQRELAYAVAEGDVGRVYEILKVGIAH